MNSQSNSSMVVEVGGWGGGKDLWTRRGQERSQVIRKIIYIDIDTAINQDKPNNQRMTVSQRLKSSKNDGNPKDMQIIAIREASRWETLRALNSKL